MMNGIPNGGLNDECYFSGIPSWSVVEAYCKLYIEWYFV